MRAAAHPLFKLIFTDDHKQQRRIIMVMMTSLLYLMCITVLTYGVLHGVFGGTRVVVLGTLCGATGLVFYSLVRSGFNLRFKDPSLSFPQALVAQSLVAFSYAISGPAHASTLMLVAMVMFYGMFDMGVRKVRLLMAYTIVLLGAVMTWCAKVDPLFYPATLEIIYFVILATALPAISSLAVQLSRMRERLHAQKEALEQALAHIQQVATHDELTGLPNRRYLADILNAHILRMARNGPGFAIAIADIDHFKRVNDTHGHRVGDEALCTFALTARAQLRNTDIIGRWGGEEFLLLLPETPPGDPNIGVERLRASLAMTQASEHAPALRIAFSTGLTRYVAGEDISETLERADRALYAAKQAGRNRTVVQQAGDSI